MGIVKKVQDPAAFRRNERTAAECEAQAAKLLFLAAMVNCEEFFQDTDEEGEEND